MGGRELERVGRLTSPVDTVGQAVCPVGHINATVAQIIGTFWHLIPPYQGPSVVSLGLFGLS